MRPYGLRGPVTLLALSMALFLARGEWCPASAQSAHEYQIKAAFIYNFTKFVEWPAATLPGGQPFVIGVVGNDSFRHVLEAGLQGKSVGGRPIVVKGMRALDEMRRCHILFIGSSEQAQTIIRAVAGASVLTISETDQFIQRGGMINFILENDRVRFEINLESAGDAGLKISSKLLSLAKIVIGQRRQG